MSNATKPAKLTRETAAYEAHGSVRGHIAYCATVDEAARAVAQDQVDCESLPGSGSYSDARVIDLSTGRQCGEYEIGAARQKMREAKWGPAPE